MDLFSPYLPTYQLHSGVQTYRVEDGRKFLYAKHIRNKLHTDCHFNKIYIYLAEASLLKQEFPRLISR